MRATAYILLGLAWVIGFVLIALLVAHLARSVAASSEAQDPGSAAGFIGPGLRGTPHVPGVQDAGEVRESAVGWHPYPDPVPGGVPLPAAANAASEGPSGPTSSMPVSPEQARTEALGAMVEGEIGTVLLGGWATWYDDGDGLYAAAGPVLRDVLGKGWRGQRVTVCADACVRVVLSDWCACGERHGDPTLLDLSPAAFRRLAPLSAGIVRVSIDPGGPRMTLPPTDSLEEKP